VTRNKLSDSHCCFHDKCALEVTEIICNTASYANKSVLLHKSVFNFMLHLDSLVSYVLQIRD